MTPDRYEDLMAETNHELAQDEQREIDRRVEHARAVCATHHLSLPCSACAGDHLAGAHQPGSHETTCARCATPPPTTPTAEPDAAMRAAGDDSLNEGDPR